MEHGNKTAKIVSISVGLLLSILMLVIGFRLLQNRGAKAAPADLNCVVSGATAEVTWTDSNGGLATVVYGTGVNPNALTFVAQETNSPSGVGVASFAHSVTIGPIPEGAEYNAAVEGQTDSVVSCGGPDSGEPFDANSDSGQDEADLSDLLPTNAPQDTSNDTDTVEVDELVAPEPVDNVSFNALPMSFATEYFNDNNEADLPDCVQAMSLRTDGEGNQYKGLAAVCSAAYTEVNSSGSN